MSSDTVELRSIRQRAEVSVQQKGSNGGEPGGALSMTGVGRRQTGPLPWIRRGGRAAHSLLCRAAPSPPHLRMRPMRSEESLASSSPLLLEAKQSTSRRPCIWGEGRGGLREARKTDHHPHPGTV